MGPSKSGRGEIKSRVNNALKDILTRQLADNAFQQRLDNDDEKRFNNDPFDPDKITPLMRAATQENPLELVDMLNTEQAKSSLFVKDSRGRT